MKNFNQKKTFDEMDRKVFLKRIVVGFDIFLKEHRITEDFEEVFNIFVTNFNPTTPGNEWFHFSDFIQAFKKPVGKISTYKNPKDPELKRLKQFSVIEDGEIHEEYQLLIQDFKNPLESEESNFLHILQFCQQNDFQELYTLIRMKYFTRKPVLTEEEYKKFCESLEDYNLLFTSQQKQRPLSEFVADFYRKETSEILHLCPRCGYPKSKKDGYKCLSKGNCDFYLTNEKEVLIDTSKEARWILKESFYYSITLPGLFEDYGYTYLIKELGDKNVTLYPECEKEGDVKITFPDGQVKQIDFKDHRYSRYLLEKLKADSKASKMDYIVVPEHYFVDSFYKHEIKVINENQSSYHIISFGQLQKEIKKLMKGKDEK